MRFGIFSNRAPNYPGRLYWLEVVQICPSGWFKDRMRTAPRHRYRGRAGSNQRRKHVNMATGTVKWFSDAKGYGFIIPDDGSNDLFAHFSGINMSGFKTLKEGQKVSFDVVQGPKGKQASNIKSV